MSRRSRVASAIALVVLLAGCATPAGPSRDVVSPVAPTPNAATTPAPRPVPGEPGASIRFGDAGPIDGTLGSWAIDGLGSDAPWLPALALTSIDIAGDAIASVAFDDGALIGSFAVSLATISDVRGEAAHRVAGREAIVPPLGAVTFGPVPRGAWVLAVQLVRADSRGEATFYWLINVP